MTARSRTTKKPKLKLPEPGDVFAIRLPDQRFGALRVLRVGGVGWQASGLVIGATTYLGSEIPGIEDARLRKLLAQHRGVWSGKECVAWIRRLPTGEIHFVGNTKVSKRELEMPCNSLMYIDGFIEAILGEDLWSKDSKAYERKGREADEAHWHAVREKERLRRAGLTLESLEATNVFDRWKGHPAGRWRKQAEEIHRRTVVQIRKLGPAPNWRSIVPIVKEYITAFNELDDAHSNFIETEEREDIIERLQDILRLIRHSKLIRFAESRTW